jgi:hypothetical protein
VIRRLLRRARAEVEELRLRYADQDLECKRLDLVRQQLEELRGGAFSPLIENPLVHTAIAVATTVFALEKDLLPNLMRWL